MSKSKFQMTNKIKKSKLNKKTLQSHDCHPVLDTGSRNFLYRFQISRCFDRDKKSGMTFIYGLQNIIRSKTLIKRFTFALVLLLVILLSAGPVIAASISDLQKKADYYATQAAAAKKKADQKAQESQEYKNQISKINSEISSIQGAISSTNKQIADAQTQIDDLTNKIKTEEENLVKEKEKMNKIVASWYMEGDSGIMEAILVANSVTEIMNQQQYYSSIKQQIDTAVDKIETLKLELSRQKEEQDKQLTKLKALKADQEAQKATVQSQQVMKQRLLSDTTSALNDLRNEEEDALKNEKAAQGEIRRIEEAAARGSSWVRSGSSAFGFMWPVNGSMGCGFGYSSCYFSGVFHTGIDLRAYSGAPIVASKAGTVIEARDGMGNTYPGNKSYGNYVMIRHEGGVSTLYGHMLPGSLSVSIGQSVSQGQVIGSMGNSGYSTGAHLHFEMRDPNGIAVDPAPSLP